MANTRISFLAAAAAVDAVAVLVDGGAAAGTIEIRTGAPPATTEAADSGVLLAGLTCSDPAFAAAADQNPGARATANSITGDASADAAGTAAHFRCKDSNGLVIIQGDVTATAGGGDLQLDNVVIAIAQAVNITAWTLDHLET